MTKKFVWLLFALGLVFAFQGAAQTAPTEAPPIPDLDQLAATVPPQDPLFPHDISAWTYTPEFADRFKRLKLKEPGPIGAYAVNFQVHQIEELDRCVFNVFLDNTLPIDYPEGPVGFLSFTYPMSWAFLKLSPADQQAVDAAYQAKYREQRVVLTHAAGEEPLTYFQNRANLYRGVAVVTLMFRCDQVATWKNPLRIRFRTTTGTFHEVGLPDHFLGWAHAALTKWRRPEAKLDAQGLADRNVWSYTPEFAKRFGLPLLNEPGPTGAEAVAFRVERYHGDHHACLLDIYLDESVPMRLPEGESGFLSLHPGLGYSLVPRNKNEPHTRPSYISKLFDAELFAIWDLRTEREQKAVPFKQHLGGDVFRVNLTGLTFQQYRRHAMTGLSYLSLSVLCSPSSTQKGPVGIALVKTDGIKREIMLPVPFLEQVRRELKERVERPFKCKYPKLYPQERCEGRAHDKR